MVDSVIFESNSITLKAVFHLSYVVLVCLFFSHHVRAQNLDSLLDEVGNIQLQNLDSAKKLSLQIEAILEENPDARAQMRLTNFYGIDANLRSQQDLAFKFYFDALAQAKAIKDTLFTAIILNNIGTSQLDLKHFEESEQSLLEALNLFEKTNNLKWLSNTTQNLAGVYFMTEKYATSINFLNQSLNYATASKNYTAVAGCYANLALIYTEINRPKDALQQFEIGLQKLESIGDNRGVCIIKNKLGELQSNFGSHQNAISTLTSSMQLAQKIDYLEGQVSAAKAIASVFEKTNQQDSALLYLKKHIALQKDLSKTNNEELLRDLETKYATEQKKQTIKNLMIEKAADEALKKSQRLQIVGLLALVLIAVMISLVIAQQLRLKQKNNDILHLKNQESTALAKQREWLLREMHHRIKNHFQMISSVLLLKANSASQNTEKASLLDARDKIQNIAITHQLLYQSSEVEQVQMPQFIDAIVTQLAANLQTENLQIRQKIAVETLYAELAINIGLIVSEAVTNCLKYAFENNSNPEIEISLSQKAHEIQLIIHDNGIGIEGEINSDSFGMKMIRILANRFSGTAEWFNERGTKLIVNVLEH